MRERPALEALHKKYSDRGLSVVSIAMDRKGKAAVEPFLKKHGASFTVLLDPDLKVSGMFSIRGTPTNFLVNRKGEAIGRAVGFRDWSSKKAYALIEALLEGDGSI